MWKLYDFFKVLQFQKRIVAAATTWENTVDRSHTRYTMDQKELCIVLCAQHKNPKPC